MFYNDSFITTTIYSIFKTFLYFNLNLLDKTLWHFFKKSLKIFPINIRHISETLISSEKHEIFLTHFNLLPKVGDYDKLIVLSLLFV